MLGLCVAQMCACACSEHLHYCLKPRHLAKLACECSGSFLQSGRAAVLDADMVVSTEQDTHPVAKGAWGRSQAQDRTEGAPAQLAH